MQLTNWSYRASGHTTPYVDIEADGDFEKVLGCQFDKAGLLTLTQAD